MIEHDASVYFDMALGFSLAPRRTYTSSSCVSYYGLLELSALQTLWGKSSFIPFIETSKVLLNVHSRSKTITSYLDNLMLYP
ncbi:unnamed protein product, partial [Dicrocoelium dendriticum]